MSVFFTTIMLLFPFGMMLFFLIQSRIGDDQKRERREFAEAKPHLEEYLRLSSAYQDYYSTRSLVEKVEKSRPGGGMTEEQKKSFLRKCGLGTTHV